ncbi:MAG TPA: hypothetical protein PLG08_08635 [Chitinophagaceae bacterium]|nr:hypothetical protein [Chitinophagaceae bacterium]
MKKYSLLLIAVSSFFILGAQKQKVDSLSALLAMEKTDTMQVTLMWKLASAFNFFNPDTALIVAQKALYKAREIKYTEGESRALGVVANTFIKIGNYPRALEYHLQKLKLEENRNNPRNMASVLLNIGVVHIFQEDYRQALFYYSKADSIIKNRDVEDLKYYSLLNLGDVYDRLNINDSAFVYFNESLELAKQLEDGDFIGSSMVGLGHIYQKQDLFNLAKLNYKNAIPYLETANDDDLICEATLGLAKLYKKMGINDSAELYARHSLTIAEKDGFQSRHLDAAAFLTEHYKDVRNVDSAFAYMEQSRVLQDSINSRDKIREWQIISSNEQLRQLELAESRRKASKERSQQLQLLLIGIFIPTFIFFVLLLSRRKIHVRLIRFLGVISLLILFEYLTLLLHPYVAEITHHTPVYELIIFVCIAALLIPTHHRIEHWLIEKLTCRRHHIEALHKAHPKEK